MHMSTGDNSKSKLIYLETILSHVFGKRNEIAISMESLCDKVPETTSECHLRGNNKDSQRHSKFNDCLM